MKNGDQIGPTLTFVCDTASMPSEVKQEWRLGLICKMLPSSCCHIYKSKVKFCNLIFFFNNQITICQAQVIGASDRLVVINFLSPSLFLNTNSGDFFQGLWGVTWQTAITCFHLPFLQEKRWCRMMSSPVTSSASFSCSVKDTIQVCGQAASQKNQGDSKWWQKLLIVEGLAAFIKYYERWNSY